MYAAYEQTTNSQELLSPLLEAKSNTICFEFNYFGKTKDPDDTVLRIGFKDLTHDSNKAKIIRVNSTQNVEWKHFKQEYTNVPRYFRLSVGLEFGLKLDSDIGIDDIQVNSYKCDYIYTPAPIPASEQVWDCNFENSCQWKETGFTVGAFSDRKYSYNLRYLS